MSTSIKASQEPFGSYEDPSTGKTENVTRFTLENASGVSIKVTDYGATITSLTAPDRDGKLDDIVLGFDDIGSYRSKSNRFFGATIGRVSNRIAKGKFTIEGKEYQLPINNGPNSLHGGLVGFDKKMWAGTIVQSEDDPDPKIVCTLLSEDGDQGYPGNLLVQVSFQLTADNQVRIRYHATTTKTTPVALTNHSYFNLGGHQNQKPGAKLEGHFVQLNSDYYTPLDENLATKGVIAPVKGTLFDVSGSMKNLKELLEKFPSGPFGYDNNVCINASSIGDIRLAARLQHKPSGRVLEVHSDQPGLQFYTGNFLPDSEAGHEPLIGKNGAKYWKHAGICLETQNWPNAVNHVNFPKAILQPGEVYKHTAIFKLFTVQ